ncbi:MAG: hypothetical protein ACI9DH_000589 [Halioglobus sp.]|jgi:hypothetical protein
MINADNIGCEYDENRGCIEVSPLLRRLPCLVSGRYSGAGKSARLVFSHFIDYDALLENNANEEIK